MQQCIPVTHSFMLRADLVFEYSLRSDNFVKQMLSDVRVHGRQGIIQQINICLTISCTGQTHTLLLTS